MLTLSHLGRIFLLPLLLTIAINLSTGAKAQVVVKPTRQDDKIPAVVGLAPGRLELKLEKNNRASGAFKLFNLSDEPIEIRTSVHHWDLDAQNKIRHIAPTEHSLDQWLLVNPLKFSIAPKQSQTVRIAARPPFKPAPGEYRALLAFDKTNTQTTNSGIELKFRLNAGVYVLAGAIERSGLIEQISLNPQGDKPSVQMTIKSTGNANIRLDGQISVWPESAFPGESTIQQYTLSGKFSNTPDAIHHIDLLPTTPVLPGTTRTFDIPFKHPATASTIHLRGTLGETPFHKTFSMP